MGREPSAHDRAAIASFAAALTLTGASRARRLLILTDGCTCVHECPEDPADNPCRACRSRDIYEPCPVVGFGCGMNGDEPCDCCTTDQWKAAHDA